jgi:hypothetical protein
MNNTAPDRYAAVKAAKKQKKAARMATPQKLQGPGAGFSHQVPARGVPEEIQEMARMVHRFGGYYGQVSEKAVNAFRRRLREARI